MIRVENLVKNYRAKEVLRGLSFNANPGEITSLIGFSDPAIFSSKEYPKLAKRRQELEHVTNLFDEQKNLKHQQTEAQELGEKQGQIRDIADHLMQKLTR